MSCDLKESTPSEFTIIVGNIKMKYPKCPIIKNCPQWIDQIVNKEELNLIDIDDINGIKDFFDGLTNEFIQFTPNNCYTILNLAKKAGSMKIINAVNKYISNQNETVQSVLSTLIDSNSNETNHEKELFLSQHYNELLKFPDILQKLKISSHMRILQNALNFGDKKSFDYHGFINFVIQKVEKKNGREYSVLLSLFNVFDFDIDDLDRLLKCENFDESFFNQKNIKSLITKIKEDQEKTKQLETKYEQLQSQVKQITKILENVYSNCLFTPEFMNKCKFLIPVNQKWTLNGPKEATLTSESNAITVKSSSTFENLIEVNPCYLFTHGGWNCWAAHCKQCENSYILIEFKYSVVANFLTIKTRKQCFIETPQIISVFAKNNDSDFVLLAKIDSIVCSEYLTQFFRFDNSSSYSSYKIVFNMLHSNAPTISLDKLNIGELSNQFFS